MLRISAYCNAMDDFSNEIVGSLLDDFISFADNDANDIPVSFEDWENYFFNTDLPSAAEPEVFDVLEYSGRDLNVLGNNVEVNSNDDENEQIENIQLTGVTLQVGMIFYPLVSTVMLWKYVSSKDRR